MDYSYAFLIILLPMLSFIILGLCGMKMSHKVAGLIGTTSLGIVTILSYVTAFGYFTADRCADGAYATVVPFNFNWMDFVALNHLVCVKNTFVYLSIFILQDQIVF